MMDYLSFFTLPRLLLWLLTLTMTMNVHNLMNSVLQNIKPGPCMQSKYLHALSSDSDSTVTNELLQTLRHFFPDKLILGSLDLIDREHGDKLFRPFLGA